MYAKNAASPQRIALGAVVQISDGAVQTSGVSIKVVPQGGAAGAGGGTTGYEEGVVHYIPTQAETNYASFMVIGYKTECIPVSVTIVTTASAVAGYAGLDWATINAPTTTVAFTGTTIATTQKVDVETIKTNPVVNAGTVTFPTTATLASTTNITAGTITTTTNLTNLPAITANWLTAAGTAADFTTEIQAGLATAANLATVAGYIDTEITDIQARLPAALVGGRMDASVGAMAANVLTAAATAADFSTEVQTGLATAAALATAQTSIDDLPTNAELATALGTADDAVLAQVALVKAKTDSLTFTVAGVVDANIQRINDVTIVGDGGATPFNV